jgi:hypothetical protein
MACRGENMASSHLGELGGSCHCALSSRRRLLVGEEGLETFQPTGIRLVHWAIVMLTTNYRVGDIDWNAGNSPVYADASELARTLNDRGFVVECIRRSKEECLFKGQKGAAWYKTDQGIFEVWFLPKTESFAALEVIEQPQENSRYIYSFRGTPRISVSMHSSKRQFFIKHGNALFKVWGDKPLADSIEKAFQKP